jgi:biopolymer transport protein ExbB
LALPPLSKAQDADQPSPATDRSAAAETVPAAADEKPPPPAGEKSLSLFRLALSGGFFMIPIAAMSLLAVTMAIERLLALRTGRVLPPALVTGLGEMSSASGTFDPRAAYRLCQQFPSAAASVVRVMLLRAGRPVAEIEAAVEQASQREADRLYANVRWLNLAASLSTLLGLIGTIQGMIIAFHDLTGVDASADRTTVLAEGIYTALVTTFAGLAVAIPSLLASHFFEGRILSVFRQIDELVFHLLPQLERYESRARTHSPSGNGDAAKMTEQAETAEP